MDENLVLRLGNKGRVINLSGTWAGTIDRAAEDFSFEKNKWGKTFFTTKFENPRFHFSKNVGSSDSSVLIGI